jgi:hypothetical protein
MTRKSLGAAMVALSMMAALSGDAMPHPRREIPRQRPSESPKRSPEVSRLKLEMAEAKRAKRRAKAMRGVL